MLLKNSVFKTQKINAITQVSQGILSTVVAMFTKRTLKHLICSVYNKKDTKNVHLDFCCIPRVRNKHLNKSLYLAY